MPRTPPRDRGLPGRAPGQPGAGPRPPDFDAVILAGGRAVRLGGVDKPGLVVGSGTMAAAVTGAAVAAGARRVILVGPARAALADGGAAPPGGLAVVREDPPGGGPVEALRAGLAEVRAPWVVLLAADLPFLRGPHLRELLPGTDADGRCPGAVLADDRGLPQWLTSGWPAGALRAALAEYRGDSLRGLLGPLCPELIRLAAAAGEPPPWLDCDTPAELAAARAWSGSPAPPDPGARPRSQTPEPEEPDPPEGRTVTTLDRWTQAACAELGLRPDDVAIRTILDLARDVAHQVERPAAPLTAFLLGLAAGQGTPVDDAARRLRELAARWPPAEH